MSKFTNQLRASIKKFIHRQGIMVARYPLLHCLQRLEPTTILDVGANVGQYGSELRNLGYRGKIHSFEPYPSSFHQLQQVAAKSAPRNAWKAHNFGLGDKEAELAMNVSKESVFNSLREPLPESTAIHSGITASQTVPVKVHTLDFVWPELNLANERVFLKMDTQGYELPILKGATAVMQKICGIQLEVSLTPLYKGQPCVEEIVPFLRECGFQVFGVWPGQGVRGAHHEIFEVDFIVVRP